MGRGIGIAALVAATALACARPETGAWVGNRFVHAKRGYAVTAPSNAWTPLRLEGADVALSGPDRARMSLSSRCNAPLASPRVLARHLRFSIGPYELLSSEALKGPGDGAWRQRLRVGEVAIEAITVLRGRCIFDWVLVAPLATIENATPAFTRWRESFVAGPAVR